MFDWFSEILDQISKFSNPTSVGFQMIKYSYSLNFNLKSLNWLDYNYILNFKSLVFISFNLT